MLFRTKCNQIVNFFNIFHLTHNYFVLFIQIVNYSVYFLPTNLSLDQFIQNCYTRFEKHNALLLNLIYTKETISSVPQGLSLVDWN